MAKKILVESVDMDNRIHVLGEDDFDNLMKVNDLTYMIGGDMFRDFFGIKGQEWSLFHWHFINE